MEKNKDNEQIRQELVSLRSDIQSLKTSSAVATEESNGPAATPLNPVDQTELESK